MSYLRDYYKDQLAEARRALANLDKVGEDVYENGTVLCYTRRLGGQNFTYAAIKAAEKWYVTGKESYGFSWDRLVEKHLADATETWIASEWVAL